MKKTVSREKPKFKHGDVSYRTGPVPQVDLDCDLDRYSNGFLYMGITDAKVREDGKEIGSIGVDVQGAAVHAHIGSRTWSISMKELWNIFMEADQRYQKDLL